MSEIAQRNPQAELIGGLRSEPFKAQIVDALPEGMAADRFVRVAITAVQTNPDLAALDVDRDSVIRSFIQCAQVGLLPDGKEAAIVLFGKKATLLPMVGGFRKIAAEHGWTLRSEVVYENDDFEFSAEPPILRHIMVPPSERGELKAAYAIARHRDGRREQKVMFAEDILKRREVARSKNVWDGPWRAEMFAKTPVRDLFLELPLDPADKDRRERLINAEEFKPNEAVAMLYGPEGQKMLAVAADVAEHRSMTLEQAQEAMDITSESLVAGLAPEATEADGGGQGEGGAGPSPMGGDGNGEPGGTADALPSLDGFEPETVAAADVAGEFVPPSGTYAVRGIKGPKPLAEIAQDPAGRIWIAKTLARTIEPEEYREAVWAFCRVYMPGEFAKAAAE